MSPLALAFSILAILPPVPLEPFEAPKYGVKTLIPKNWPIADRESEDRVFVALIQQANPERPGVAACELGLAPESLEEYRKRIDSSAKRGDRPGSTLSKNELVKHPKGDRLETIREFRPSSGILWREVSVRLIVKRQMYTFVLNVDEPTYADARPAFNAIIDATEFASPNTGADLVSKPANRWLQREFKFALDLPEGWLPVLAPSEVALLFANAPPKGIWSDNLLVIAQEHHEIDLHDLERKLPEQLLREEPNCEVQTCRVVKQGDRDALETVVRTKRGPFSMTVLERRFRGDRFDYEVKYTLESDRFDALAPALRKSLESFRELPGATPGVAPRKPA